MGWLARWVRTTFDYNPTFPISALLLLLGLRLLDREGALDVQSLGGTAGGVGVLQAYEVALLGLALAVLWPRRIAYETTAVLIIFGVVRYAAPFLIIGHAAEGSRGSAVALGAGLAALMALKDRALLRGVGLDARGWERAHDALLYGLACVALPLLAQGLATWTGGALSHAGARGVQVAVCWGFALLLAPLAVGLPDLGREGPLRSRRPAALWRGLSVTGLSALLANALWLGGDAPVPYALLPLALVSAAVFGTISRACGLAGDRWTIHLPALAALAVLAAPLEMLLGRTPALGRAQALLLFLPVAAAALPLLAPARWRDGLSSLGAVAALAPLTQARSAHDVEVYALLVLLAVAGLGAIRRDDRTLWPATLAAALVATHLAWRPLGDAGLTLVPLGSGAGLLMLVAWRCPEARVTAGVAAALVLAPGAVEVVRGPAGPALLLLVAGGGGLAALGLRRDERVLAHLGLALPVAGGLRRVVDDLDPGLTLVLLAFAALPLGTVIALRRERRRAGEEPVGDLDVLDADARVADARVADARGLDARAAGALDLDVRVEDLAGADVAGVAPVPGATASLARTA